MATQKEKAERALYGPGWIEVTLGAALSLILGIALAFALLVLKPINLVKEMPKEPEKGAIYYVEGAKNPNLSRQATAKRQQFLAGSSVTLTEEELNALLAPAATPAAAGKAGEAAPAPAGAGMLTTSAPNFRILDGKLQVAVPSTLNVAGTAVPVTIVATGNFQKSGDEFVFVPDDIHVNSLAAHRIPAITNVVRGQIMTSQVVPPEVAAAWKKITAISVEGKNLVITM